MLQQVTCKPCGEARAKRGHVNDKMHAVYGIAVQDSECEICGNPINPGDRAVAITFYRKDEQKPDWEKDYVQEWKYA